MKISSSQVAPSSWNSMATSWLLWCCVTGFYAFQFIPRVFLGLIADDLMQHFSVNTAVFGLLSSFWYIGYSTMQIPAGMILDRFRTSLVIVISLALCIFSLCIFSYTTNFYFAAFSRFVLGGGSAFALLSTAKVVKERFPSAMFSALFGATVMVGVCSTFLGVYMKKLMDYMHWTDVMWNFILLGCVILLFTIVVYLRDKKSVSSSQNSLPVLATLKSLLLKRDTWVLGLFFFFSYSFLSGFADMWGVSFLHAAHGIDHTKCITLISVVYIGMGVGAVFWPFILKFAPRYLAVIRFGIISSTISFGFIAFYQNLSFQTLWILSFAAGFFIAVTLLTFTIVERMQKAAIIGTASGLHNLFSMLSGVVVQPLMGYAIGSNAAPCYNLAMLLLFVFMIIACVFSAFLPNTPRLRDAKRA